MTDSALEIRVAWQRHLGRGRAADDWFESIVNRYRESHRHYHDVRHLRWVVRHVERIGDEHPPDDLGAVVAAAFFHDVVYDPTADDNEAVSARFANDALGGLGWADDRAAHVAAMIDDTAQHRLDGADADRRLLFAADLAVLAAEPAGYADYVRNVRREYRHVDDADWVTGRSAVLRGFLAREAIFAPELELGEWERRARGNITSELDDLGRAPTRS